MKGTLRIAGIIVLLSAVLLSSILLVPVGGYFSKSGLPSSRIYARASSSSSSPPLLVKCRDCWAGFGVNTTSGLVTSVNAKVKVPTVTCTQKEAFSFFMVALDGYPGDLAYSEVYVACLNSSAIYGGYYFDSITTTGAGTTWAPRPGDIVYLSVSASGNKTGDEFKYVIDDLNTTKRTSSGQPSPGAGLYAASCVTNMMGGYPAVNFGIVKFMTCNADVGGTVKSIGYHFTTLHTLRKFISYNSNETVILALPSQLSVTSPKFTVTFKASGP
jgi:hypothetical protein